MPDFLREHRGPLAGAAGLHVLLIALFAGAALRWTSSQPPVELAIEGYVVEGPVKARPLAEPREPRAASRLPAAEAPAPQPDPPAQQRADPPPQAAPVERTEPSEGERLAAEQRASAEAQARIEDAQAEAEAARRAEAEVARKAVEAEARRKAAAEAARQQAEADTRAERETALQRRLAAEEEAGSFARSGVIDEYRALLVQTIERNWIRPPSAASGLQCTLHVTQAPGGTVVDVRLGACNGDGPVRESIVNAVYRSSPLPAPRDPRALERRLEIVFKPTE
jgi:colicin import membrane protein